MSAATPSPRDLSLILRNRSSQLATLGERVRRYETALILVTDAVMLSEAKRVAREALSPPPYVSTGSAWDEAQEADHAD